MGGGGDLESGGAPSGDRSTSVWARVRSHKIIQWGVGYLGAAFALAQGAEVVGNAFDWPDVVGRGLILALIAALPLALALAWYHGHRGLQKVSKQELGVLSALVLIGAAFFATSFRLTGGADASANAIEEYIIQAGKNSPAANIMARNSTVQAAAPAGVGNRESGIGKMKKAHIRQSWRNL